MCLNQNLEEESQGLESSQDHVIKESIACRSGPANSDTVQQVRTKHLNRLSIDSTNG